MWRLLLGARHLSTQAGRLCNVLTLSPWPSNFPLLGDVLKQLQVRGKEVLKAIGRPLEWFFAWIIDSKPMAMPASASCCSAWIASWRGRLSRAWRSSSHAAAAILCLQRPGALTPRCSQAICGSPVLQSPSGSSGSFVEKGAGRAVFRFYGQNTGAAPKSEIEEAARMSSKWCLGWHSAQRCASAMAHISP